MTTKHTPGKWVWHTHDEETWRIYGTAQLRDCPADGCYAIADVINGNGDERQNAANRDLLVAAPALYEALARLLPEIAPPPSAWDDKETGDDNSLFRAAIDRARHALALARGEA